MSTTVAVNTYVHTATYIAGKMLLTLKEIVRGSGLDPGRLATGWTSLEGAVAFHLRGRHLQRVTLEVYTGASARTLVGRWDLDVNYSSATDADDGSFWTDTEVLGYTIQKAGVHPSTCSYRFVIWTAHGAPDYPGWSTTTLLSTDNFARYSVGTQIGAPGAGVETSYWVKK